MRTDDRQVITHEVTTVLVINRKEQKITGKFSDSSPHVFTLVLWSAFFIGRFSWWYLTSTFSPNFSINSIQRLWPIGAYTADRAVWQGAI